MTDRARRIELINGRKRPRVCPRTCPLHPRCAEHNPDFSGGYVPPLLHASDDLLVVAICPAEEEELGGEPLIGPSGRYANHAISWAGGAARAMRYSKINVVNCRTVRPGRTRAYINRTPPTMREMRACFEAHLRPALRRKWRCVLLLGADAYKFVIPTELLPDGRKRPMFDAFAKAMGHRMVVDIEAVGDDRTRRNP